MIRSAFLAGVFRCPSCSVVFAWPQPASTDALYEESYFQAYESAGLPQVAEVRTDRFRDRLLRAHPAPGRLLEIGVGQGAFLNLARAMGWEVLGLDVSKWAGEQVQRRYGIRVLHSTLEVADLPPESFDVVHMSHVLEHCPAPVDVLATAARLLTPHGRIVIEVPNEFENVYTWARLRARMARQYEVASTHLWFFSPSTLDRVVGLAGLRTEFARTFRDIDDTRLLRRVAKAAVAVIERVLNRGPLIELIASRAA